MVVPAVMYKLPAVMSLLAVIAAAALRVTVPVVEMLLMLFTVSTVKLPTVVAMLMSPEVD